MTFWQKLGERFTSTKFLMALMGCITSTIAFAKGAINADVWIGSLTVLIAAWSSGQAKVDAAKVTPDGTGSGT